MSNCCVIPDYKNDTEVKKYKVTPLPNRFIPDIINNGRIIEPGVYELNIREVNRVRWYGHMVEEIDDNPDVPPTPPDPVDPPDDEEKITNKVGKAKVGYCKLKNYGG